MAKFHIKYVVLLISWTVSSLFAAVSAQSDSFPSSPFVQQLAACGANLFVFGRTDAFMAVQQGFASGNTQNVTNDQVVAACQAAQGFITCLKEYADSHIGQDNAEALEITRGTVKFMEICGKPDLLGKATKIASCGRTLESGPGYRTCLDNGERALKYLEFWHNANKTLELLRAGGVLKDLCCLAKDVRDCIAPALQKCSADEVAVRNEVYDHILSAYGCAAKTADGCPIRVYPTTAKPQPICFESAGKQMCVDGAPKSTAGVLLCTLAVTILFFFRSD